MAALVSAAWLLDQAVTVGAVASMMVDATRAEAGSSAGPMLPATSVPAPTARVTVAVTPSAHPVSSKL